MWDNIVRQRTSIQYCYTFQFHLPLALFLPILNIYTFKITHWKMNIKYLGYARYSTASLIFDVNQQPSNKQLAGDIDTIFQKIRSLKLKILQRQKVKADYGIWFVIHDKNDVSYALCTNEQYPQRHAFGLIGELQKAVNEITHAEYETEDNIKAHTKKTAVALAAQYNDLRKIDKIHQALDGVKDLEGELGEGIKKLIVNKESLEDLDGKADRMRSYAGEFEKGSADLERMLYWRNMKVKILAGIAGLAIIGFIVLIIVQKAKN